MTLTLDDVRNMKFRMAKRSGYEVIDVDQFVDQVEEAFAQLTEENQHLKQQVESLQAAASESRTQQEPVAAPAAEPTPAPATSAPATNDPGSQTPDSQTPGSQTIVVRTAEDASPAVIKLVQSSIEQAERMVDDAQEESKQLLSDARQQAGQIAGDARSQAERMESEARVNADRVTGEAQNRATALDRELEQRRRDMFSAMESERDQLREAVAGLRSFEQDYRSNLAQHLRSQLDGVENGEFEPQEKPELLDPQDEEAQGRRSQSDTPRLDALLGNQN